MLIECANCGAPLNVSGTEPVVVCNYCARQNKVQETRKVAAQTPAGWQPPPNWVPPGQALGHNSPLYYHQRTVPQSRVWWPMLAIPGVLVLMASLITGVIANRAATGDTATGFGGIAANLEHMQWNAGRVPPVASDLNADGIEDVLGLYRILTDGDTVLYLGAFNGKDLDRLWNSKALGSAGETPVFAVQGEFVAVTDSSNFLHILSKTDGNPKGGIQLSDKASRICVDPGKSGKVWVEQVDKAHQLISLDSAKPEAAPRPQWCPAPVSLSDNSACWSVEFHRKRHAKAECLESKKAPEVEGFRPEYLLRSGKSRVGIGTKHPGTSTPMASGYSEDGSKVLWTRALAAPGMKPRTSAPDVADLLGSKALIQYELKKKGARLLLLNAANGKSLWDVAVPHSDSGSQASAVLITTARVYLPHWTWLDIFDANSGEHVGTIGKW